ncbi:MAG: sugar transferase [Cyanophyceae cyanobacterium]
MHTVRDIRASIITKISALSVLGWVRVSILLVLDALSISLAWLIAEYLGTSIKTFSLLGTAEQPGFLLPILVVSIGILYASGLYSTDDKRRSFPNLFKVLTLVQIVLLLMAFLYQPGVWVSRSVFLLAWFLSLIFVGSERLLLHSAVVALREKYRAFKQPIFILGHPHEIEQAKKLLKRTEQFCVQGTADLAAQDHPEQWAKTLAQIRSSDIAEVFVCSWQSIKEPIFLFWALKSAGIQLRIVPISLDIPRQWSEIKMIGGFTTLRFNSPPLIGSEFWLKRSFDLTVSVFVLLLLSLPMLAIALLIRLDSPGPIFYKQARVGLKGKQFEVWKFRTMIKDASKYQQQLEAQNEVKGGVLFKIKEDPRITRVGKYLRQYSLDELPQLFNVLRGEMSLVGPRPLPLRDVERFSKQHFLRHEILPGITGLWQVSGRSNTDSEEIFYLDLAYIQHWSLALDFQILLKTVNVVLTKKGAY